MVYGRPLWEGGAARRLETPAAGGSSTGHRSINLPLSLQIDSLIAGLLPMNTESIHSKVHLKITRNISLYLAMDGKTPIQSNQNLVIIVLSHRTHLTVAHGTSVPNIPFSGQTVTVAVSG
ncbi:hypothetical protein J6590_100174 [Homalodisca vitripennis]|nr:hypothetical protein J6590_100174 [Homalodisca vitripennis]